MKQFFDDIDDDKQELDEDDYFIHPEDDEMDESFMNYPDEEDENE